VIIITILSIGSLFADERINNKNIIRTFTDENGNKIDEIIVPGSPPGHYRAPIIKLPDNSKNINILSNVPAFDWCYGCCPTSAAMMAGYYDRTGYPNVYDGSANNGIMPMNNSWWGYGECPLSVTHMGYDGLTTYGHVDDYWIESGNSGPDPYIVGGWPQHIHADCTGDFMGSSQSAFNMSDGATVVYYLSNGAPLYDYTGCGPYYRDGCHGIKLFFESRDYTVIQNYSQYIFGYGGNTQGFTFDQFKNEIDMGRPVLFHLTGHFILAYGYDENNNTVYVHDTWDHYDHEITWGGSYYGMEHFGCTIINLNRIFPVPTDLEAEVFDNDVYLNWCAPVTEVGEWSFYHDGSFEYSFSSIGGGSGLAQLFTPTNNPCIIKKVRFLTSSAGSYSQPEEVYVLSGDGTTVLGGPYFVNGVSDDWITIDIDNIQVNEGNFMIATYNILPGGPYISVDNSIYDSTLYYGNHISGFTEMGVYGYYYVGSHEVFVEYTNSKDSVILSSIKPQIAVGDLYSDLSLSNTYSNGLLKKDSWRNLIGYNVYRDGNQINSSIVTNLFYEDLNLMASTYEYEVTAVYDEGESETSNVVVVTITQDTGSIEGTVTLIGGSGLVTDVEVTTGGITTNPTSSGNYSISLPAGIYDVTSTLSNYIDSTITNVVVLYNQTTTDVDFILYSLEPIADFSGIPAYGCGSLQVQFTDLSTNNPTSWLWDFGDGYTSNENNPIHEYTDWGVYTVSLTSTNSYGSDTETKVDYIAVNGIPIADAGADQTVLDNEVVYLDGSGSYDPEGDDINYHWVAPPGIELSDSTIADPTFISPDIDDSTDFAFLLTVDDGECYSNPDTVIITVINNPVSVNEIYPNEFELIGSYPNPIRERAEISFGIPERSYIKIELYDMRGHFIEILTNKDMNAGYHKIECDMSSLKNGIYFYKMSVDGVDKEIRKVVLLR